MDQKPIQTSEELVRAFADLFDEVDLTTPEEIDETLRITGHNPDEVATKMREAAEQAFVNALQSWRQQALERLEEERARIASFEPTPVHRRVDIISTIKRLNEQLGGRVALAHRNLESETDESLASLLHHLEYLVSRQSDGDEE